MTIWSKLSNLFSKKPSKWWAIAFAAIALVGFLDATYLTMNHYQGSIPPCNFVSGCDQVLTSEFSKIGKLPVALLGSVFYLTILLLSLGYLESKNEKFFYLARAGTIVGFLASMFFLYLQLFVIYHMCIYCMISVVTSTALFLVALGSWLKKA